MAKPLYMPGTAPAPEDRRNVKSAWDDNYDPHYGNTPQGDVIMGTNSFANMRDDMNERRRQMARRIERS